MMTEQAVPKPLAMKLLHSLLRSKSLQATAALGASGLALACGNLILARVLPEDEFARFALIFSIVMIGISLGPIGADVCSHGANSHPMRSCISRCS